jgi:hypothetical protein
MMQHEEFLTGYISAYKTALASYLEVNSIVARVDSLTALVENNTSGEELRLFTRSVGLTRDFIISRYNNVVTQLDTFPDALIRQPGKPAHTCTGGFDMRASGNNSILSFSIDHATPLTLSVIDLSGRQHTTVYSGFCSSGTHEVLWNPGNLTSGVYLIIMQADAGRLVGRVIVD